MENDIENSFDSEKAEEIEIISEESEEPAEIDIEREVEDYLRNVELIQTNMLTPTKPSLPNNLFRNEKQIKTSFGVSKSLNSSIIAEKKNLKLATKSDKKKLKKKHNQNLKIEIIKETDSDLNTFYKKSSTIRKTVNSSLMTYSKPQILSFHEALNDYHQIEFSSLTKPKNI